MHGGLGHTASRGGIVSSFQTRLPRFRRLRATGILTARLLICRTSGMPTLTFGQSICGVALSMLLQERRAPAAVAAPAAGLGGQSLDLALLIADETSAGKANPVHAARVGPFGE